MKKIVRFFRKYLPFRMGVLVLMGVIPLFVASLMVMFYFSHVAIEHEALEKARQTLDGTVLHLDNMMQKVQVATTNMRWNVEQHIDDPAAMDRYCMELVKNNPNVRACAIALVPNFYRSKGMDELFMAYAYRAKEFGDEVLLTRNPMALEPGVYGKVPYVGVNWYFIPMQVNQTVWVRPHAPGDTLLSSIVTCSAPIHDRTGQPVGVLAADISLDEMSQAILNAKPFPNSYSVMLGVQGTYLVHPDSTKLYHQLVSDIVKEEPDPRVGELVELMLAGKTGCRAVTLQGEDCYVLYESLNEGHWSACIVCPQNDIFGGNEKLQRYMVLITLLGLMFIFAFCFLFFNQQLQPLNMLVRSAQRIARGNFSNPIPPTKRHDEIGNLQNGFRTMQESLSEKMTEMSQATAVLQKRGEELQEAYHQVQEADRVKTNFIHQVADKMIPPVLGIDSAINAIWKQPQMKRAAIQPLVDQVMLNVKNITNQIDQLLNIPRKKKP